MSRSRANPWSPGQKIAAAIGGTIAVAAGILLWRENKRMAAAFEEIGKGLGGDTINYNYVPHLSTWPHMDRYGNEHAFGIQLQQWGYDPGPIHTNEQWAIIDAQPIEAVRNFQLEYNLVRQIELPAPMPGPPLVEDGLIGASTATA